MPPLKRKITAGSDKRRVIFNGGPWDNRTAWVANTINDTGVMTFGNVRGQYKNSGVARRFGRRFSGPDYFEFKWHPAPYKEPKRLADLAI